MVILSALLLNHKSVFPSRVNIHLEQVQHIPPNNNSYILKCGKACALQYIDDVF